jgi:hypothetical protein
LHAIRIARAAVFAAAALFFFPTRFAAAARADEPPAEVVGVIEGEAISVTGPMSVEVVQGEARPVLRNGSDVLVKSGTARIDLVEGGQITICGPAHLSVLNSGGALTVALDTGTIHVHVEHEPALTIYTAQIQAQPVAIGDGPQDFLVGLETSGAMCIRANRGGAVRIEQQLTGESFLIRQASDVVMNAPPEWLHTSAGRCACEMPIARRAPPPQPEISQLASAKEVREKTFDAKPNLPAIPAQKPEVKEEPIYQTQIARRAPPPQPEISQLASAKEVRKKTFDPKPNLPILPPEKREVREEPIYQVLVPPPVYDANAKVQPDSDPPSVAEAARRAREQKQAAAKPAKAITDPDHPFFVKPLVYDANAKVQPEIDPRSVVEAARRAREQKQAAAKPAKVITDDGVKHVAPTRSRPVRRAPATASPASDATGAPAAAGSATPGPRDEKSSKEVAALKEQIKQGQGNLDLLRREQALQLHTYYSNPDYTHNTAGKSKLDGMKQQIGDKQQELDRLKARLGELGAAPEARARDMRPDRAVAIKILPVQLSSDACTQAVLRAVLPDESSYRGYSLASYDCGCRVRCLALQGMWGFTSLRVTLRSRP